MVVVVWRSAVVSLLGDFHLSLLFLSYKQVTPEERKLVFREQMETPRGSNNPLSPAGASNQIR